MVAIDPRNGYIKAMASSSQLQAQPVQPRRAGPPPARLGVQDLRADHRDQARASTRTRPITSRSRSTSTTTDYGPWKVQTYDKTYGGAMNLVQATLHSDNTVYAQLDLDLGPEERGRDRQGHGHHDAARRLPGRGPRRIDAGVSPLEMADAYATLAAGGMRNKPIAITKVAFPDGKSDDLGKPKRKRVFSDGVAYEVTKILEAEHHQRHRHARQHRLPRGRQDRHHRQLQRRLVRRLHAEAGDVGLGRLPERAAADAQRPRDLGRGRHLPGRDLARLHERREGQQLRRLPAADHPDAVVPFFGKYSRQSGARQRPTRARSATGPETHRRRGYRGYDPRLYRRAPPRTPTHPAAGGRTPAPQRQRQRRRQWRWERRWHGGRRRGGAATGPAASAGPGPSR